MISRLNIRRCQACPIYGSDLVEAVTVIDNCDHVASCPSGGEWNGRGKIHCLQATSMQPRLYWSQTGGLHEMVHTPESYLKELKDTTDRYVFCIPPVVAPAISMRMYHPPPSKLWGTERTKEHLKKQLLPTISPLHHIMNASVTQFPDPRLIQYDCGKLPFYLYDC